MSMDSAIIITDIMKPLAGNNDYTVQPVKGTTGIQGCCSQGRNKSIDRSDTKKSVEDEQITCQG